MIILKSSVNYTHNTSMEVGVRIEAENLRTGKRHHTASAYLTFVSLSENKKPQKVRGVKPFTDIEKKRYHDGKQRHLTRKERISKEKAK
mgnify:CR=1 FL=1